MLATGIEQSFHKSAVCCARKQVDPWNRCSIMLMLYRIQRSCIHREKPNDLFIAQRNPNEVVIFLQELVNDTFAR